MDRWEVAEVLRAQKEAWEAMHVNWEEGSGSSSRGFEETFVRVPYRTPVRSELGAARVSLGWHYTVRWLMAGLHSYSGRITVVLAQAVLCAYL